MICIGVDAGGTNSRCLVTDAHGAVRAHVTGPGANLHQYGIDNTARSVAGLVHEALARAGGHQREVHAAVCVAGLDTDASRERLDTALRAIDSSIRWQSANDALAAWYGAFGTERAGVIAIAGTGSAAYARNGEWEARAGGWGAMLGDEGSGYDLGRRGLIAVLRAHDRIGPATSLRGAVLGRLGLDRPEAIIDHLHFHMAPADVAALAPVVLGCAAEGDPVAEELVDAAAASLIEITAGAASAVGLGEAEEPLFALVGGVARDPFFRAAVRRRAGRGDRPLRWHEAGAPPVAGAVYLAMSGAGFFSAIQHDFGQLELEATSRRRQ